MMVSFLYDPEHLNLSEDVLCKLMMDSLYICIDYRNMSAHGGRIYNYTSPSILRADDIFGADNHVPEYGLSNYFLFLVFLNIKTPINV